LIKNSIFFSDNKRSKDFSDARIINWKQSYVEFISNRVC